MGISASSAPEQGLSSGESLRVLLVEDDPDHADLFAVMLGPAWRVRHEGSLRAGLAALRDDRPDVVLLDLNLPDSAGVATAVRVCAEAGDVPVVVTTAQDDQPTAVAAFRAGAEDLVVKGRFEPELLKRTLRLAVERRRTARAVARLAAVVEASADAIVAAELSGVITSWNGGAERLYGHTAAEVLGRGLDILETPQRRGQMEALLRRIAQGEVVQPFETQGLRRDGTPLDVWWTVSPVSDGRGRVAGVAAIARDVTEQHRAQVALRRSEERYRQLFDANPQPMWVSETGSLRFLAVNEAACRHYGYSEAEFAEMTLRDLRPPEEVPRLLSLIATRGEGVHGPFLMVHRKKDGTRLQVEITAQPIQLEDHEAEIAVAVDVTERERLEQQLRQAQKMEALGRLAGGVAHDFNNIIGVITGYAELALRSIPAGDAARRRVEEVLKAADRATDLTHQLLTFSRRQVLEPRVVNLNRITAEMDDMLRRLVGEDVQLVLRLAPDLGHVRADPGQVMQILVNLAANGRDAMPNGGRLLVETTNVALDQSDVPAHPEVSPGPYVLLAVSDSGVGMSRDTLARAFEPFFTTKESKGTGLGLATVYGIVRQSGGHVEAHSEPGRGSVFKVYLPRVDALPEAVLPDENARARGGTETVLLVEDDAAVRAMSREVLEEAGYTVLAASAGDEALAMVQRGAAFDLVLTDVVMPRLNGPDLAERLRSSRPLLPVVFMSGYTEGAILEKGALPPHSAFVDKPFTPERLLRAVRGALDER